MKNLWIPTLKQGNIRKERHSIKANIMATANLETKENCKRDLHVTQSFQGLFLQSLPWQFVEHRWKSGTCVDSFGVIWIHLIYIGLFEFGKAKPTTIFGIRNFVLIKYD